MIISSLSLSPLFNFFFFFYVFVFGVGWFGVWIGSLYQVDIWEERKVFGSRGQNLKNEMLGKNPAPVNNVRTPNPIKVVKRDATSVRIVSTNPCLSCA